MAKRSRWGFQGVRVLLFPGSVDTLLRHVARLSKSVSEKPQTTFERKQDKVTSER
ncbi:MAG: hypothetical protein ACKOBW_16965 [Planctomycetota bacterium]